MSVDAPKCRGRHGWYLGGQHSLFLRHGDGMCDGLKSVQNGSQSRQWVGRYGEEIEGAEKAEAEVGSSEERSGILLRFCHSRANCSQSNDDHGGAAVSPVT